MEVFPPKTFIVYNTPQPEMSAFIRNGQYYTYQVTFECFHFCKNCLMFFKIYFFQSALEPKILVKTL